MSKPQYLKEILLNPTINKNLTYDLCYRCKIQSAQIKCINCAPSNKFCKHCDNFIHSSKPTHSRSLIEQPTQITKLSTNCNQTSYKDIQPNNHLINNNTSSPKNTVSPCKTTNIDLTLNSCIKDLESELNNFKTNTQNDLQSLSLKHQNEINTILNDNQIQVEYLTKQISFLEKENASLRKEVSQYIQLMSNNKNIYGNKVTEYESEILALSDEIRNLKLFYTDKVDYYKSEMERIKKECEDKIEIMKKEFDSKEKEMTEKVQDLQKKLSVFIEDQKTLTMMNSELKGEIGGKEEMLEKVRKEIRDCKKEKNKIKKRHLEMEANYTKFKNEYDRLHRITHGKFRTKTFSHENI